MVQLFKKSLILFWAIWWLIAFWTDLAGGLAHIGLLHASFAPDTNYPFLVSSLKMYPIGKWVPPFLFFGIILWSGLVACLFFWSALSLHRSRTIWMSRANIAFVISLMYWLCFFIADQMVMKFDLEENHMVQGGFELLTFLSLYLLPEDKNLSNKYKEGV